MEGSEVGAPDIGGHPARGVCVPMASDKALLAEALRE